ncbi:MAG TPA: radical SAM protein [Pseudonocardiaceae bacterium]
MRHAVLVQLPFPSTRTPDPRIEDYYVDYDRVFRKIVPEYFIPTDGLWEMPLWVAHLTALLDHAGLRSTFADLSRTEAVAEDCAERLLELSAPGDLMLMSPLAQNFDLAIAVARLLWRADRRTVLGGNMAPLAAACDAVHLVHRGQLDAGLVRDLVRLADTCGGELVNPLAPGLVANRITWSPEYRHLDGYHGQVPMLRLNASHGCLYGCSFCGDSWSSQLTLVSRDALAAEVDQLAERFPDTRLVYIGDKTFGQSREAVRNLLDVFAQRPGYRFIVQTHVMQVRPWVVDAMRELGVVAVELGFESGDSQMLKRLNKLSRGLADYAAKVRVLHEAGLHVVLNVMGGLDEETEDSHRQTVRWLADNADVLWLFNLYSFVPYPLTPDFARLRPRIFNWEFADWREDLPPVYRPANLTPERSWEMFGEKIEVTHGIVRRRATTDSPAANGEPQR